MCNVQLCWKRSAVAADIAAMLELLAEDYPIAENGSGIELEFVKVAACGESNVTRHGNTARIEYGSVTAAARGVGTVLSGLEGRELMTFATYGIMLDASRNGVMTVEHFKKWLRQLALMGYNMAMLYTEDTYKLPDEPYFGYMRGAYTLAEMQDVDAYAAKLGIEMIACIQTLGHMEQIIKWGPAYAPVTDTARVLNVDEDATYDLVAKMLKFWSTAFRSRKIHIGMDETHDLGRGRLLDKYGYKDGFTLFNQHLNRVNDMCKQLGLSPMIWSDMYFRLGNANQDYYDLNSNIPQEVRNNIPENVELVYWDYYHDDYKFYHDFIKLHQELNRPVALGSGVWTWSKFWYDHTKTKATVLPGLQACRDTGVQDVFFTMWGDDGAYCAWDSAMAGLVFSAEVAYGNGDNEAACATRFAAICHGDYAAHTLAGNLDIYPWDVDTKIDPAYGPLCAYHLFWDEPVMGLAWNYYSIWNPDFDQVVIAEYQKICDGLKDKRHDDGCADLNHPYMIAEVIIKRLAFRRKMLTAYHAGDRAKIAEIAGEIPAIISLYEELCESFRAMWIAVFKPFGFEVMQIRNAGQIARWHELQRTLLEYSSGKLSTIAELDEKLPLGPTASKPAWYKGFATSSSIL